jgi:pyridoxine 5-phosphate synthase
VQTAIDIQKFGGQGITIHPRPDERHIRYQDARDLKPIVTTEFNIEGNPQDKFLELVLALKPTQVTLVPDAVDAITSDAGWDTLKHRGYLTDIIAECKRNDIRTSIFVDPTLKMVEGAAATGTDRIELYTEAFAEQYALGNTKAIEPYTACAVLANTLKLGVNAGHDLSLDNIKFFKDHMPGLLEVSIGHALVSEALYDGLESVVKKYLERLA